ncbi:MAG: 5-histidylcysteine sulfoxide synthase [Campylobacterota bacterium]|nr:5-histidylcysteine sulfoxide synthase [Campylobacterota bacterium]
MTGDHPEAKREAIREYFHKTYDLYERLFDLLATDEVFYEKSEPTRHPMIFYFGHTATFYINKLILAKVITQRVNPEYESLFAIGVDEMNWDDLNEANYGWPDVDKVRYYRKHVRKVLDELITTLPLSLPITESDPFWIILMGIEHERIHIETSSVLHRQMPIRKVRDDGFFQICNESVEAPENVLVEIKGGHVKLGKPRDHHLYGWDNEYGHEAEDIGSFKASKYLVSNGEFMEFVDDGGYDNDVYWDEEGKKFLELRNSRHPLFWVPHKHNGYRYRALTKEIDMPLDWPVDVNCLEARAFCRWKSDKEGKNYRLPTEAEWMHLYERTGIKDVPDFDDTKANINLRYFASSCPVDKFVFGDLCDVVGNVWQWTETAIDAFEGFQPHPAYDDFSTPTFDGKHNLLKGGSWISSGNEIMKHSRYAFRRHFYQHAGFRYVEAAPLKKEEENIYESDTLVSQYCEFQYGAEHFGVKNFSVATAELAIAYAKEQGVGHTHALDLGCATGRTSFELAKFFNKVTGIDFSARFIQVGVELQKKGRIGYRRTEEGDLSSSQEHSLAEFGLEYVKESVAFWQGDACNLKAHFRGYDLLLATNLIDRLYDPRLFLETVHERINEGGMLILTSPYTWQEESTAKALWLGGYKDSEGSAVKTLEGLKQILDARFELVGTKDIPFVIRETSRKFQHTIAEMSVWKKKG